VKSLESEPTKFNYLCEKYEPVGIKKGFEHLNFLLTGERLTVRPQASMQGVIINHLQGPGGCAHMRAAMYYIPQWMLASSIPEVDGACIWLPYFNIALYIGLCL